MMKNGLLVLNAVLLIAVGVLFWFHFRGNQSAAPSASSGAKGTTAPVAGVSRIAYFEMDSVESAYQMVKDVKAELEKREAAINNELASMEKGYQRKIAGYQQQGATMTQVQSEAAQRDVMQMQQNLQARKQSLDKEYQDTYLRKMKDVKTAVEDFLTEYNRGKGYTYIFAADPGLFYYRDSTYNITPDLVKGLNAAYAKPAK